MNASRRWAVLALLLAAFVATSAQDVKKPKPAATPEEAVQLMISSLKAADFDGLLACIAEPARPAWQMMVAQMRTREALDRALDDKLGKDPKAGPRESLKDRLKTLKRVEVIGKGEGKDGVDVMIRHVEELAPGKEHITYLKWRAVKDGNAWKISMPPHNSKRIKVTIKGKDGKEEVVDAFTFDDEQTRLEVEWARKALPKFQDAMGKVQKEIKDGKYATREEAEKAFRAAERAFFEANPPPATEAPKEEKKECADLDETESVNTRAELKPPDAKAAIPARPVYLPAYSHIISAMQAAKSRRFVP